LMTGLAQDVRYALRQLRKSPGFTAVAVLTLALGIGANTAVFSLIDAVMLRVLPVYRPQQLVILRWSAHADPSTHNSYFWSGCPGSNGFCSFSYPAYEGLRREQKVLAGIFAFVPGGQHEITGTGETHQAIGQYVSGDFFSTLGVQPAIGRALQPADDVAGAPPAVVISYGIWQSLFAGDRSIVGKPIRIDGVPFTIAGITAPGFIGIETGIPSDFWLPLSLRNLIDERFPVSREVDDASLWLEVGGRLKPEISKTAAQAALSGIFTATVTSGPAALLKPQDGLRVEVVSASRGLESLRQRYSKPLYVLMAAVALVLLIACANVAGLVLVRGSGRRKEVGVRVAIGATRSKIIRQFLTEGLILAFAGGSLGVLLAYWGASFLVAFLANLGEPLLLDVSPDLHILLFTLAASCIIGIFCSLGTALRTTRVDPIPALKENASALSPGRGWWGLSLGNALAVFQVAFSLVLLVAAGLLVQTLVKLEAVDPGFSAQNLLLFSIDTRLSSYKGAKLPVLYHELQGRLEALPGVISASYSGVPLLSGAQMTGIFQLPGRTQSQLDTNFLPVGPRFFETMQITLSAGRVFTSADFQSSPALVPMIVNQDFVRHCLGNENPLGRAVADVDSNTPKYQIVGVVADTKYDSLRKQIRPTVYVPVDASADSFEVRTAMDPKAALSSIRDVLRQVDSGLVLLDPRTQVEQVDRLLYQERLLGGLSSLFGFVAMALACLGLYGLLSYEVTRRTHEIGVRLAVGAMPSDVQKQVIVRGIILVTIGLVMGAIVWLFVDRLLSSLLFGVGPSDATTLGSIIALLLGVALLGCYIPARRAAKVDPMVALRYE
jgi:predicted permease